MPTYALDIQMPANTPSSDPIRSGIVLEAGTVIEQVILHVPSGHAGLAPVRVEMDGMRIVPVVGDFRLDNVPSLAIPVGRTMLRRSAIELVGYNEDTVNPHATRLLVIARGPGGA
jgi:hypothetical protein